MDAIKFVLCALLLLYAQACCQKFYLRGRFFPHRVKRAHEEYSESVIVDDFDNMVKHTGTDPQILKIQIKKASPKKLSRPKPDTKITNIKLLGKFNNSLSRSGKTVDDTKCTKKPARVYSFKNTPKTPVKIGLTVKKRINDTKESVTDAPIIKVNATNVDNANIDLKINSKDTAPLPSLVKSENSSAIKLKADPMPTLANKIEISTVIPKVEVQARSGNFESSEEEDLSVIPLYKGQDIQAPSTIDVTVDRSASNHFEPRLSKLKIDTPTTETTKVTINTAPESVITSFIPLRSDDQPKSHIETNILPKINDLYTAAKYREMVKPIKLTDGIEIEHRNCFDDASVVEGGTDGYTVTCEDTLEIVDKMDADYQNSKLVSSSKTKTTKNGRRAFHPLNHMKHKHRTDAIVPDYTYAHPPYMYPAVATASPETYTYTEKTSMENKMFKASRNRQIKIETGEYVDDINGYVNYFQPAVNGNSYSPVVAWNAYYNNGNTRAQVTPCYLGPYQCYGRK